MRTPPKLFSSIYLFLSFLLSNTVFADPPTHVGRLSYIEGSVSLLPAEEEQWVESSLNRPLIVADSLWVDTSAKAELQFGLASIWLNSYSSLKILNLSDNIGQFQLAEGTMILNVRTLKAEQSYEIDTPNLALTINKVGYYRVQVKNEDDISVTAVSVMTGLGQAYGQNSSSGLEIKEGITCQFRGVELQDPVCTPIFSLDEFDNWVIKREKRILQATASNNYVSTEVIGYEDFETYGTWKSVPDYGDVWVPEGVGSDWAPYRDGHWIWLNQWGWTWVDNQPWGFAPFHYGRWTSIDNTWVWVPGPVNVAALYAPALVVFLQTDADDIAWFPLGPGEVFVPAYPVTPTYFNQINISNTHFTNININNWYNQNNIHFNYKNRTINNAITAVPKNAFIESQPVNKEAIKLSKPMLLNAKTNVFAPIAPTNQSILGGEINKGVKPPEKIFGKPAIFKSRIPTQPKSFSQVRDQLIKNPGKPLPETTPQLNEKSGTIQPSINAAPGQKTNNQTQEPLKHPTPLPNPSLQKIKPLNAPGDQGPIHMKNPSLQQAPGQQAPIKPKHIQPPPIQHTPGQQAPIQPNPMQTPPVQHAPGQQAPIQPNPMQTPPVQHAPGQQAPIQPKHMQAPPVQHAPGQQAPIQPNPIQTPPVQHTPGQQAPMQPNHNQAPSIQHAPGQQVPMQPKYVQPLPRQNPPE